MKTLIKIVIVTLLLAFAGCSSKNSVDISKSGSVTTNNTETIVIVRHAEKPKEGLGQLSIVGLKRSLLLPYFFKKHFNRADYIFAPNPAKKHFENHGDKKWYCYVRPLATIEPTAITLGLPVDTSFGLDDTSQLVDELLKEKYHNSNIYIAWEHSRIIDIAKELIEKMNADNISLPKWRNDNYNMVFVFRIDWNKPAGQKLSFETTSENFNNLADKKVEPAYLN